MKKVLLGIAASVLACGSAFAERGDALKPVRVLAASGVANMVNQGGVFEGNVELTRGTLILKADKLNLTEDPQGYHSATLFAGAGALATVRQKRAGGGDLWVEGEAERIDYDDKNDTLRLTGRAKVRNLDGTKVTYSADGPFISYDNRKELFSLNTPTGQKKVGDGRVEMIFDQKARPAAPAAPGKQ